MIVHAVLLAGWLFAQGLGNNVVTPPQEVHVTNTTVLNVPPMDPQAVSDASITADQAFIVNVAQPVPVDWVNSLCSLPDLWRTTPPNMTYQQPAIHDLAIKVALAANGLLVLAVLAQGLGHALGQELALSRVVFAMVMSIGNLIWWQIGIDLNNALAATIGAPDVCATLIRPHIELQTPAPGSGTDVVAATVGGPVLVIVYAIVSLFLLISLLFRLGLIDVLIAAGSLAHMTWATDQSAYIAQWYTRLSVGTVLGQVLLTIGLSVAGVVSGLASGAAGTLLALVVLLLCRSLLGILSSQQAQNRGTSMGVGMFLLLRRIVARV